MKKNFTISIPITLLMALGLALVAGNTFYGQKYIDREGAGLSGYRGASLYVIKPNSTFDIKQQIVTSEPGLASITIPVKSSQATELHLSITNVSKQTVDRETTLTVTATDITVPITWTFDPLDSSSGTYYWLTITGRAGDAPLNFLAIDPSRYDGGNLLINGSRQDGQRIVIDWQYFSSDSWHTVMERLTYAKPGIWGHQATIILLILIACISTLIVIVWLTYICISDDSDKP